MKRLIPVLLACIAPAAYGAELGEAGAVTRGLENANFDEMQRARSQEARARAESAGRWANPQLEFSRETAAVQGGDSEDRFLWVRQRLDLAGVKAAQRDAARSRRQARQARLDYARRERAARVRERFYQCLADQSRHNAVMQWQQRLQELVEALTQRVEAGDAARYDVLRLEQELSLARSDASQAQSSARGCAERLFGLIGGETAALTGQLSPPPAASPDVTAAIDDHPLLRALAAERKNASFSARVAERRAWPQLSVGLGHRQLSEPGLDTDGDLFAVQVEIPLFDRHQHQAQAASSRAAGLDAERALTRERLAAEARAALAELAARRAAVNRLQNDQETLGREMTQLAENAYLAGELGITELLDAHRSALTTRRERINRALQARQSYIDWQLIQGE